MAASRKTLPKSDSVKAQAAADRARKAASKAALKAERDANVTRQQNMLEAVQAERKADEVAPPVVEASVTSESVVMPKTSEVDANFRAALVVDAKAVLGEDAPQAAIDAYVAEQIAPAMAKAKYTGPMLALRSAAKHYVKGANGNPHCGDQLAAALDGLTREEVVATLIAAMKLPGNPYTALNPGQQSMNLRNKARGQLKNGVLTITQIMEAKPAK